MFANPDGDVPRNWNSDIKAADRRNPQHEGDRWLRGEGESEDGRFAVGGDNINSGVTQIPNFTQSGGKNQGSHMSRGVDQRNLIPTFKEFPNNIMQNPCYDESALEEENENDEYALIDLKKRKRLAQLNISESSKVTSEEEEMQVEKDQLHNERHDEDHFLTASPGIGACREL